MARGIKIIFPVNGGHFGRKQGINSIPRQRLNIAAEPLRGSVKNAVFCQRVVVPVAECAVIVGVDPVQQSPRIRVAPNPVNVLGGLQCVFYPPTKKARAARRTSGPPVCMSSSRSTRLGERSSSSGLSPVNQ